MNERMLETLVVELEATRTAVSVLASEMRSRDPEAAKRLADALQAIRIAPSAHSPQIRSEARKLLLG
ncbi:MAG: hypothetical protein GAK31_01697 [Stenotrophomonas maltophilia]|uniref:Uncharacterized protein n=1 Tax=Stenotrophomonas maltophilia TaxID=40324 RepID=A0A7V8FI70_STEMA|nr:MAG: hypothetical protein GAK31_01697 [Stenotrophomonas maltophilia]